jgi:hypothetical protein
VDRVCLEDNLGKGAEPTLEGLETEPKLIRGGDKNVKKRYPRDIVFVEVKR